MFQLDRLKATVVELEHFSDDGAVFLPGFSPAKLRENASHVTGIDALKAAFEQAKEKEHVLVTGHHAKLSEERAKSVQFLLMGNRFAWASLSASVATTADKDQIRHWSPEPLPVDDAEWTVETWGKVFDLYMKELTPDAPAGPPKLKKLPNIVARYGKDFVPHKVAIDAKRAAADYLQWNPYNPGRPKDPTAKRDIGWNPVEPGETVWLPPPEEAFWDIELLRAAGWDAYPAEYENATPEPPQLCAVHAVGCDDRHLVHPYKDSPERRAVERHAEVLILPDEALACEHGGECGLGACEVYDVRMYTLIWRLVAPPATGDLLVHIPVTLNEAASLGHVFVLESDHGGVRVAKPLATEARPRDNGLCELRYIGIPTHYKYRLWYIIEGEIQTVFPYTEYSKIAYRHAMQSNVGTYSASAKRLAQLERLDDDFEKAFAVAADVRRPHGAST